jgi:hypothetical protein
MIVMVYAHLSKVPYTEEADHAGEKYWWVSGCVRDDKGNVKYHLPAIMAYPWHGHGKTTALKWVDRIKNAEDPKAEILRIQREGLERWK